LFFKEEAMKKALFIAFAGFILGTGLFAQENSSKEESEYYYISVPIETIFLYREGYIVAYRTRSGKVARTYIPRDWFSDPSGKVDQIYLGSGKDWPHMSVYYKSGEFSHVRLYVRREKSHETWSVVPLSVNLDEHFVGVEEIILEF
jgi:hypothetical protein